MAVIGESRKSSKSGGGILRNLFCFLAGAAVMHSNRDALVTKAATAAPPPPPTGVGPSVGQISDHWGLKAKSLHPKWKLWHEMNAGEQEEAYAQVVVYINKYGKKLSDHVKFAGTHKHGQCEIHKFGVNGGHSLCGPAPPKPCNFISFGINDDPSFDREIAEEWGCSGIGSDPTVDMNSHIHPKVTFHNFGATMLSDNDERIKNKGGTEDWIFTSMPSLRRFLSMERIDILKLDCEGCEFAFARDILAEDPDFLKRVDQLSIETHVSKVWLTTKEQLYYFGLQFPLLEEAGHVLEFTSIFGCNSLHEWPGCSDEIAATDFPCGYRNQTTKHGRKWAFGKSCHDFLWKRP